MALRFNLRLFLTFVHFFVWMYSWACATSREGNSMESFDYDVNKSQIAWSTNYGRPQFEVVNASKRTVPGAPVVDTTLGTGDGKYCIAKHESPSTYNISWLFSTCFMPSNPKCTLRFSGFLNIGPDDEFYVCAMRQCAHCQPVLYQQKCFRREYFTRTDRWTVFEIVIGYYPIPFDISIGANLRQPGSFAAVDDIQVIDCHSEKIETDVCDESAVFQCNYTYACITRDQLCDLTPDCDCGEDEANFCEIIPLEGLVTLTDCSLDDGSCLWYNTMEQETVNNGSLLSLGNNEGKTNNTRWEIHNKDQDAAGFYHGIYYFHGAYMSVDIPPYPESAVLRSVSLKPRYDGGGLCQIRFHYLVTSTNARLQLILKEVGKGVETGSVRSRVLWEIVTNEVTDMDVEETEKEKRFSTVTGSSTDSVKWKRVVVDLNAVPINVSYVLQFQVTALTPMSSGQVMIHSLTLGWECFSADIFLTTCGFDGPEGPDQQTCDGYHNVKMVTKVMKKGREKGVQTWIVPETQIYRIYAYGARGGLGLRAKNLVKNSKGAKVTATFNLTAGEQLYFLIGQRGSEACPEHMWNSKPPFCQNNATFVGGGGGGGGGATVVYKKDNNNKVEVLIVAGGGGGLPYDFSDHTKSDLFANRNGNGNTRLQGSTETTLVAENKGNVKWMDISQAEKLAKGSLRGTTGCSHSASTPAYWGGSGGFGGGGGACAGGGHGGGATALEHGYGHLQSDVGEPGLSFVHPDALSKSLETDSHESDGIAEVESLWYCPCAYRCMWRGSNFKKPVCLCPKGKVLGNDSFSCEDISDLDSKSDAVEDNAGETSFTTIILITLVVVAIAFSVLCICLYLRRPSVRNGLPIRVKKTIQIICPCLNLSGRPLTFNSHVLPQITHPPAIMQENSIYNRVTTKGAEPSLNEIPRKHLKLIGELGQGAFGEVFYGLLSHMPMVDGDLPVAVKTLPAVCTEQTEMDFLLEALIVSKFNHPNIVKFIGTCFDQRPHYLILELLEGGDLKSFLYQARPKRDVQSSITMVDLLCLSLDIARGCQHLEEKHFIHRDIAARNCLLTTKGPNRMAKIADFGMARDIYRSDYYKKAGRAMLPVKWMPPEAFLDGVFTSKTDVWSYGILLWEVFSLGHMPYPGCSNEEVMNLVTKGGRLEPPVGCPSSVFDIMTSCWAGIAEARPNFSLIISILERTIQDDETSSRGLPVFYTAPIIHTRRTCTRDSGVSDLSKGACSQSSSQSSNSRQSKLQVNFETEQSYLEPLISRHSECVPSKHVFFPT